MSKPIAKVAPAQRDRADPTGLLKEVTAPANRGIGLQAWSC